MEELTCQNEELRKIVESQNVEHQQTDENQNEEESNSQANRRDRTSGKDSTRMENELHNMRKEIDKLKSAVKDKGGENLDGMIRRTNSSFITEILNRPFPLKFHLPQLESYDSFKDPLDHIESFKTLMLLQMTPNEVMCKAFPTTLKGVVRVWFSKIPLKTIADFEQLSKGFVVISLEGKDTKSQLPIFSTLNK